VIDSWPLLEQLLFLALGQTSGDNDATGASDFLLFQHFTKGGARLGPRTLDKAASVDDDEIGPLRLADKFIAIELEQAQHPLAVNEIFRAAETDKGVRAF
jgi:hypothetical protein